MIYVYSGFWPYARKRVLRAANVDYAWKLMAHGAFSFELPSGDTGVQEDDLIAIVSSRLPAFAGFVDSIEETGEASVNVSGREWSALLGERVTKPGRTYQGASGQIASDVVRWTNARNNTGIGLLPVTQSATISSPVEGDTPLAVLSAMHELSGWEWEVRYRAGPTLDATFFWRQRVGFDLRGRQDLSRLASVSYSRDSLRSADSVQAIGGTGPLKERKSAVSVASPAAYADIADRRYVIPHYTPYASVAQTREQSVVDQQITTGRGLRSRTESALQPLLTGAEALEVSVPSTVNWRLIMVGNTLRVRVPSVRFGTGIVRDVRVMALQPDEQNGICRAIVRVV